MKLFTTVKLLSLALIFAGSSLVANAQVGSLQARANAIVSQLSDEDKAALLAGDAEVAEQLLAELGIDFTNLGTLSDAVSALMFSVATIEGTRPSPQTVQTVSTTLLKASVSMAREAGVNPRAAIGATNSGLRQGAQALASEFNVTPAAYMFAINNAVAEAVIDLSPVDTFDPPTVVDDDDIRVVSPDNQSQPT
jgi:hypothetical protein